MSHPTDTSLFAWVNGGADAALDAHLSSCPDCARRARRLRGGAAALSEAKRSMPDISWVRLDEVMAREAESAARVVRVRAPASRDRWPRTLALGFASAAVVAGVVLAMRPRPTSVTPALSVPVPVAQRTAPSERARVDATVLLATAGATARVAGASSPLGEAALPEGAVVETAAGARAVLSLMTGVRVDLRPASVATLAQLRTARATVTLDRGAIRLARAEASPTPEVTVQLGAWSVRAEGDLVAERSVEVVRVVILGGRAALHRGGEAPLTFSGPVTLELPDAGPARTVRASAEDPVALDLSAFDPRTALSWLPPTAPGAVLSLADGAVLPSGLSALRIAGPRSISARVGQSRYTIEIGTGRASEWRRVLAAREPALGTRARRPAPPQLAPASTEVADPGLTPAQISGVSRAAGMRIRHCFSTCVERNLCEGAQGQVRIQVQPNGSASLAPIPSAIEGARRCLENEMRTFRGAPAAAPYTIAIGFNTSR